MKIIIILLQLVIFNVIYAEDKYYSSVKEIEQKIEYVRKELKEISSQRQKLKNDYINDSKEFQKYRKLIVSKKRALRGEVDSISNIISSENSKKEKLLSKLSVLKLEEKNFHIFQKSLTSEIIKNIDSLTLIDSLIPPLAKGNITTSLEILKKDLETENVDVLEAINRYFTILHNLDNLSSTIQVTQTNSNVSFIRGLVYRFRIGSFYEAVVSIDGKKAGLWTGYKDGKPVWKELDDVKYSLALLNAIQIREGKAVPAVGNIVFDKYKVGRE